MPESSKNLGGRPTDFKEEYIHQAYITCRDDGYTNAKLSKLFNVHINTISNWLRTIPEFAQFVYQGKDEFDSQRVEKALNKRATGFRYTEVTREPNDQGVMSVTKKVSKLVVPDTKACEFWLCNRNPERWKKLKHVELAGKDGKALIDIAGINKFISVLEKTAGKEYAEKFKQALINASDS